MNLLYTITSYPPALGGAQLQFHTFARALSTENHIGVIYQWDTNRTDWLLGTTLYAPISGQPTLYEGVSVCRIAPTSAQRHQLRLWVYGYRAFQGLAIQRIADSLLPQMESATYALLNGKPDLIHNSRIGREPLTAVSLQFARQLGVPFVLTPNHHHHWKGWVYRHYLRLYREADAIIVYTAHEKNELIHLGVQPERIHILGVVPLLSDTSDGDRFRASYQIPADAPLILFIGQKYLYKRFEWLLKAMPTVWKHFPKAHAVFIGPRTMTSERIFSKYSDPRIQEIDTVSLQEKTDALNACTLLCLPSEKESFGTVFLEAWQFKKPVIGGSAPASQQIIHESAGGLCALGSSKQLAEHILTFLGNNSQRDAMGLAGFAYAQRYQLNAMAKHLQAIYDRL